MEDNIVGAISQIKPVTINGVECTIANCRSGDYSLIRPLYFLTKGEPEGPVAAFIAFCYSEEGKQIIEEEGYISIDVEPPLLPPAGELKGTVTEAGSTTVQPLAERLAEAFMQRYPEVEVVIQGGGSSVGVRSCADGTVDIGAISRDLKPDEPLLVKHTLAYDAIAVIVHPSNKIAGLTTEQLRGIFAGEISLWSQVTP